MAKVSFKGYLEKYYFYYGSYTYRILPEKNHTYEMDLAFFLVTIIGLLVSAISMILR